MWTNTDGTNTVDNKEFLTDYWRARARANSGYENTYTLGMRGVHDGQFTTNMDKKTAMTEIIAAQREILRDEVVPDGKTLADVPQVFIPYKEILTLYNSNLQIPDDVTLMWPDDNFGYIRQFPTEAERQRSGGAGIYYHLSYYGRPRSYLWLSSTQPALIREEMTKAYDMGAQKIWVVNVGDLKPAETEMEYFLDLARDVDGVRNTDIADWLADNAKRDFGFDDTQAAEYADIKLGYYELTGSRRPEHMSEGLYSLTDFGDEGQKVLDRYADLEARAERLYDELDADRQPSFYELLLYPLKGAHAMTEKYVYADKAKQYNDKGYDSAVNKYAQLSDAAQDKIVADTNVYTAMLGGKWNKMMNPFQTKLNGSFGGTISGKLPNPTVSTLPYTNMEIVPEDDCLSFTKYSTEPKFIDIINTGSNSFDWRAETSADWVKLNKTSGTVADNDRIYVNVNSSATSAVKLNATIIFNRYVGNTIVDTKTVGVTMDNTEFTLNEKTYVESDGSVSIEAENYTNNVTNGDYEWKIEKDLGRSGDSVKIYPDTAANVAAPNKNNSAYLEYQVYFTSAGTFPINVYRMPTINELSGATQRFRIGIDDGTPVQFNGNTKTTDNSTGTDAWGKGVLQNTEIVSGTITVPSEGLHTVRLYNESAGIVIDKIVITTGETKASYFGAPESYNTTYNNTIKALPTASVSSTEQTGNAEALFEPKLLIGSVSVGKPSAVTEGIKITDNKMTVKFESALAKDAYCYVAAYNNDGSLSKLVKSNNTVAANSADREFTFDEALETPANGTVKAFIWTDKMEPAYKTLGEIIDAPNASDVLKTNIVTLANTGKCTFAAAVYDGDGNMLNVAYTAVDLSDVRINGEKELELNMPSMEGGEQIQIMALADLSDYEPIAPAVTLDSGDVSLMAAYEDGYAYPAANLKNYIGREAVCVIEEQAPENGSYTRYIRQETLGENTFKKIPFNRQGKFDLKIKVGGAADLIKEKLSTIINIQPDTEPVTTEVYKQTFDAEPADGITTITAPAAYDSANKCVKMTPTAASGGKVTVDFSEAVKSAQGEKLIIKSDIAYGNLTGKYMNYDIVDSNGNAVLSTKINRYTGMTQSLAIGGKELLGGTTNYPSPIQKLNDNEAPTSKYTTFTTTIDVSSGDVTVVVSSSTGSVTYEGKLADNTSYDIKKLDFTTDYNNVARSCYVDNISISKARDRSYTMKLLPTVSGALTTADSVTVTDRLTNAVIASEADGTYKLCDGVYAYAITAGGKTQLGEFELSPATESKTLLINMETGEIEKPAEDPSKANVTITFVDEEGDAVKSKVTVEGDFKIGDSYSVPDEYLTDLIITSDGLTKTYEYNAERSTVSSDSLAKDNNFVLVYNMTNSYIFYEDYESYDMSAHAWTAGTAGVKPQIVTEDGNSYLKYTSNGNTHAAYEKFASPINCAGKEVTVDVDLKFAPSGTAGNSQFTIGAGSPTFSGNKVDYGFISSSTGHIIAFEYKEGSTLTVNGNSVTTAFIGDWMHMTAVIDFNAHKVDITLTNDSGASAQLENLDFFNSDKSDSIGSYYVRAAKTNGTVSIDNFKMKN